MTIIIQNFKLISQVMMVLALTLGVANADKQVAKIKTAIKVCDEFANGNDINYQELAEHQWSRQAENNDGLMQVTLQFLNVNAEVSEVARYGLKSLNNRYDNVSVVGIVSDGDTSFGFVEGNKLHIKSTNVEKYCYVLGNEGTQTALKNAFEHNFSPKASIFQFPYILFEQGKLNEAPFGQYIFNPQQYLDFLRENEADPLFLLPRFKDPKKLEQHVSGLATFGAIYLPVILGN